MTIRLGSIAKHLSLDTRLVVADAVAYDSPASRESTEWPPSHDSPRGSPVERQPGGKSPAALLGQTATGGSSPRGRLSAQPPGVSIPATLLSQRAPDGSMPVRHIAERPPSGSSPHQVLPERQPDASSSHGVPDRPSNGTNQPGSIQRLASQRISWASDKQGHSPQPHAAGQTALPDVDTGKRHHHTFGNSS